MSLEHLKILTPVYFPLEFPDYPSEVHRFDRWEMTLKRELTIDLMVWSKKVGKGYTDIQITKPRGSILEIVGDTGINEYFICDPSPGCHFPANKHKPVSCTGRTYTKYLVEKFINEYALFPSEQPAGRTKAKNILPEGRHDDFKDAYYKDETFRDPPNR